EEADRDHEERDRLPERCRHARGSTSILDETSPVVHDPWEMSAFRAFAVVLLISGTASADIYQYTDKDGVVHIVNTVPHGVSAQLLVRGGNAPRAGAPIVAPSDRDPARLTRYDEWIRQACTLYQIPEQLVRAVIKVESDY